MVLMIRETCPLRKESLLGRFAFACAVIGVLGSCLQKGQAPAGGRPVLGVAELNRLDLLPRLKQSIRVGCASSYDRTGGNDDGFTGKSSFLRKESGGLVIADLQGPGIIYRIHLPSPTDEVIEFYFDGESSPRISRKIPELFAGTHAPFLAPLVGSGVGGHYCYVPLAFQKSCKILVKTETFHFYQVNYAQYPPDFVIPTYEDPPSDAFLRELEKAGRLMEKAGTDITQSLVPEGTPLKTATSRMSLGPGQSATVFETTSPGRIVGLKLSPAEALAGKERDIVLKMFWDGSQEPAVAAPTGDFFGASFGDPAVRSLLLGTSESTDYVYFPMPFARSARIELVSERASGPPLEIKAEVTYAALGKAADEGRFYARWRRENPTREGTPYSYLRTTGRGHVVGVILQAQGLEPGHTAFFEGDDRAVIDGELAIPGTGSEDSFNGGWYDVPGRWERRGSFPLSGCLDYEKPLGRTGGYRWLITDAYPYTKTIDYTIEHGPEGNKLATDYTSVTFFYSAEPPQPGSPLPPASERRVMDPDRFVFVPGWNVPIHTFSIENATLTKRVEKIGAARIRILSMRTLGDDIFGPHHISFVCDVPSAGNYKVGIKAVCGPDQGIVRIYRNDVPAGEPANLYAKDRKVSPVLPLGTFDMKAGENFVFLDLVGKDPMSKGLGLDLAEIVFEKVK
jgi:hypothetical protein